MFKIKYIILFLCCLTALSAAIPAWALSARTDLTPAAELSPAITAETGVILQNTEEETQATETFKANTNTALTATAVPEASGGSENANSTSESSVSVQPGSALFIKGSTSAPSSPEITPVELGTRVDGALENATAKVLYSFTIEQRGAVTLSFSHSDPNITDSCWKISILEEYDTTGNGGAKAYRQIDEMSSAIKAAELATDTIGLYPGTYILAVSAGNIYSASPYFFKVKHTVSSAFETEPNDNIYRYCDLALNRPMTGKSDLKDIKDEDWFMFTLPADGVVKMDFEHKDLNLPQVGWLLSITDCDGNSFYSDKSLYSDTLVTTDELGLTAGTYFACVQANVRSEESYTLTVNFQQRNDFEKEPNDTKSKATELVFSGDSAKIRGSISDRTSLIDRDWYTFSAKENGIITLSFFHDNLQRVRDGWNIALVNEDGDVIYSDISQWTETDVISPLIGIKPGKYYIGIDADNLLLSNATYLLTVAKVNESGEWENEKNNSFDTANRLMPDSSVSGTLVNVGLDYDTDCYYFDIDTGTYLYVIFEHANLITANEGWNIEIYDTDRKLLESFTSKWVDTKRMSEKLALTAGRYYIKVDTGTFFCNKKYTLSIQTVIK